jgi:hypothetical protein
MSSISFWRQNEAARAAYASANDSFYSDTSNKLFTKGNPSASTVPSVMTPTDTTSIINGFGQAVLNQSMNAAILYAQMGKERVQRQAVEAASQTATKPIGDYSSQVTWSGALKVDFGADGQPMGGGYGFVAGKELKDAFKVAFGAKKSNGETIDTVRIEGNTLIGSTSGEKAHDVFTLSLKKESGLYTFKLLAPIDQVSKKGSYNAVYLRSLMRATSATGEKLQLPEIEIDIYNDYGEAEGKGNWGLLHEASLTYVDPNTVDTSSTSTDSSSSSKSTAYTVPTDSRTLHGYTTNPSAAWAVINSVNIFS